MWVLITNGAYFRGKASLWIKCLNLDGPKSICIQQSTHLSGNTNKCITFVAYLPFENVCGYDGFFSDKFADLI